TLAEAARVALSGRNAALAEQDRIIRLGRDEAERIRAEGRRLANLDLVAADRVLQRAEREAASRRERGERAAQAVADRILAEAKADAQRVVAAASEEAAAIIETAGEA